MKRIIPGIILEMTLEESLKKHKIRDKLPTSVSSLKATMEIE